MFHKVKSISPLADFKLSVQFSEGVTKLYDVKSLFKKISAFSYLKDHPDEFACVAVDVGGYGIIWNDELDLSCDELWEHGVQVNTPSMVSWRSATLPNCGGLTRALCERQSPTGNL